MNRPTLTAMWAAALFALLTTITLPAQEPARTALPPAMERIARPGSTAQWIDFREGAALEPERLFEAQREAFLLRETDEMRLQRTDNDALGFTHYRFQQYYKDIPVWGAEMIVHADAGGGAYAANGKIAQRLELNTIPTLPESRGRQKALALVKAEAGPLQGPATEKRRQLPATSQPAGELVIVPHDGGYRLAWQYSLPEVSKVVFLDAQNGELLFSYPLLIHCEPGTVATPWYGVQNINISRDGIGFLLHDDCREPSPLISVSRYSVMGNQGQLRSPDSHWGDTEAETAGGTTLWGLSQSFEYFHTAHGRYSWDGNGADIDAVIEEGVYNAYWDGYSQELGFGTAAEGSADDFTTLDIVAHELAHAVTQATAGLVYMNESGALNESFSDIFGEMVEAFTLGHMDWLTGGDRGAIRSLSAPGAFNQPDTYEGDFWCDFTNGCTYDNGGVHINSGVQNHWFFLLSVGGEGINSHGRPFSVEGIGTAKAAAITYRNLSAYMFSTATHEDARSGSLQAAADLFGPCSPEYFEVSKAWYAVGVGNGMAGSGLEVCGTITSGSFYSPDSLRSGGAGCLALAAPVDDDIIFTAAEAIILKEGFRAVAADTNAFYAYIGVDCPVARPGIAAVAQPNASGTPAAHTKLAAAEKNPSPAGAALKLFPNPASGRATVSYSMPPGSTGRLMAYDSQGQLRLSLGLLPAEEGSRGSTELDISHLSPGLYFFRLVSGGYSASSRLVVVR